MKKHITDRAVQSTLGIHRFPNCESSQPQNQLLLAESADLKRADIAG